MTGGPARKWRRACRGQEVAPTGPRGAAGLGRAGAGWTATPRPGRSGGSRCCGEEAAVASAQAECPRGGPWRKLSAAGARTREAGQEWRSAEAKATPPAAPPSRPPSFLSP